ncbi:deoxyribose-phosphate aldolase [Paenibacillus mendelii]|uniref:Deoxyribose-phosphate aldolase n=1 Tax=Paenibacillus mendelii TaxID=206163 RepID=A0ABV6J3C6_9BACL|nr:deoxyribose-phosphate aldolase [Paenibacillus mendelii]MCQ6559406.1 deoxyribose-phosphate aldolase [Paenibacillus mendelii]
MEHVRLTGPEIARIIDHTLLKPSSTRDQIIQLCKEAVEHRFATVCVNPYWVPVAYGLLKGTEVGITTVIGFPLGSTTTNAKVAEARDSIANGATEIDMVINLGALKSGELDAVELDIHAVVQACKGKAFVKVILETGYLTDEEKSAACLISKRAGADFVKTCTGFGPGEASVHDIALMRETVGPDMGVKASAGIRDKSTAEKMIAAGADRLGTSSSIAIITNGTGEGY